MSIRDLIEDELKSWATRYDAAGLLPELVRRLLLATAPLRKIEMRAGQGTRLGGFDGRVIAEQEGTFWPGGESVWELSVEEGTVAKLNRDYDQRVDELKKQGHTSVPWTYVAVTARMSLKSSKSSKKDAASGHEPESWVDSKKKAPFFRDVRVLDASDLAMWLSQAPVVRQWFLGTVLRQPTEYTSDIERMLEQFSNRTRPPLDFRILCQGKARIRVAEQVRAWAMQQQPNHLFVQAASRDEAAHFVAAALATSVDDLQRGRFLSKTMVVWNEDALLAMQPAAEKHQLILIANFDDVSLNRLSRDARIVIPLDPSRNARGAWRVDDVPWSLLQEALQAAGISEPEARRLAAESGNSLAVLQRSLGYEELPQWAQGADITHLAALVLVGAWQPDPASSGDRAVMQRLTGNVDETEQVCELLHRSPEQPMRKDTGRGPAVWSWAAHPSAWKALVGRLPATTLRRFEEIAIEVLAFDDTVFHVPAEQRLTAAALHATTGPSEALRAGIAKGLALLGNADDDLRDSHGASRGSRIAATVLRKIFDVVGPRWQRWASLSRFLPDLGESSPSVFLEIMKDHLAREDGPGRLFNEEVLFGPSPHVGLLWAIERLAWSPKRLRDCAVCFARLHEYDRQLSRQGQSANRPLASLGALVHPFRTQTDATPAECESVLRAIAKHTVPSVGMDVIVHILEGLYRGGLVHTNATPQVLVYTERSDEQWQQRVDIEYTQRIQSIERLAVELAGNDGRAWARLMNVADRETEWAFLDVLQNRQGVDDSGHELWSMFRQKLHWYALNDDIPQDEPMRVRLRELYQRFTPTDVVAKYAWLFARKVDFPEVGDWDECEQLAIQERKKAIEEIWGRQDTRVVDLSRMVAAVEWPHVLGEVLATASFAAEVEPMLTADPQGPLAVLVPPFLSMRAQNNPEKLMASVVALNNAGQTDAALKLLHLQPGDPALWAAIKTLGEPLHRRYWNELPRLWGRHDGATWVIAIDALLDADNATVAADALLTHVDRVDGADLLRLFERFWNDATLLQALLQQSSAEYWMAELLEKLDGDDSLPSDRVGILEWKVALNLSEVLGSSRRGIRLRRLSALFAAQPSLFVDLLRGLYRAEGVPEPVVDDPEREKRVRYAQAIFGFLWHWRGYPGEGLPFDEANSVLERWARAVLEEAGNAGFGRVAPGEVAKVLSRGPVGADGIWPGDAARKLLEEASTDRLRNGLAIAKQNARGTFGKAIGEGGAQEREFAVKYRREAAVVREQWPATALLLEALADRYSRNALTEDEEAVADRRQHGLDEVPPRERSAIASPRQTTTLRKGLAHIRRIEIENLRCFDSLTIENIPFEPEFGQNLILLGVNGTGKTTLLRAIAAALLDEQAAGTGADMMVEAQSLLRDTSRPGSVYVTVGDDVFGVQFVMEAGRLRVRELDNPPKARPFVVGYGCFRGSLLGGDEHAMAEAGSTATLWSETMRLWPSLRWLRELRKLASDKNTEAQNLIDGVSYALQQVLHDISDVAVESERLVLGGTGIGGRHSAHALSDGYLGMMGWVLDMIARWSERMKALGFPISANFLAEMEGVALVDDIDLHLHPLWQRDLLKRLQTTFPRMTFVGTTHHPQTILGVRKSEKIQVLRRSWDNPERVEVFALDVPIGRRADQVLTSGWFGLDSTLDDETLKWMNDHQKLVLATERDEAKIKQLEEQIQARIHRFVDTAREAYAYGIVLEIIRDNVPNPTPEEREKAREKIKELAKARLAAAGTKKS